MYHLLDFNPGPDADSNGMPGPVLRTIAHRDHRPAEPAQWHKRASIAHAYATLTTLGDQLGPAGCVLCGFAVGILYMLIA